MRPVSTWGIITICSLALLLCACSSPGSGGRAKNPSNVENSDGSDDQATVQDDGAEEPETASADSPERPTVKPPVHVKPPVGSKPPPRGTPPASGEGGYTCTHVPLPSKVMDRIRKHSWREGCPVELDDLAYMRIAHWGYDNKVHMGEMIVHQAYAPGLKKVFRELFKKKFPIQRMRLVDEYGGDDNRSMLANNTSAFNCRPMTGYKKKYSKHAWGGAIDVNPLYNPYVKRRGTVVQPEAGRPYVDRSKKAKGLIRKGDVCHKAFSKQGWRWGGLWRTVKDYQHFEIKDIKGTWRRGRTITGTVGGVTGKGKINIFTPRGYSKKRKPPFRLLIALHGWRARAGDWEKHSRINYWANKYGFVIVAPEVGTTVYERKYYPETREKYKWGKIPGGKWVGEVVLPYMRRHYNVYQTRARTGIFGLSTGGRGAALLPAYYPEFRAFAALSGDYDITKQPKERTCTYIYGSYAKFPHRWRRDNSKTLLKKLKHVSAYLAHGKRDRLCKVEQSRWFCRDMKKAGYDVECDFPDEGHTWKVWDGYLGKTFKFLDSRLK